MNELCISAVETNTERNKLLVDKLNAAANAVIDEMKEATKHAV